MENWLGARHQFVKLNRPIEQTVLAVKMKMNKTV